MSFFDGHRIINEIERRKTIRLRMMQTGLTEDEKMYQEQRKKVETLC